MRTGGDAADMSRKNNLVPGETNVAAKDLKVMDEREHPCFFFFFFFHLVSPSVHPECKNGGGREGGERERGEERGRNGKHFAWKQ